MSAELIGVPPKREFKCRCWLIVIGFFLAVVIGLEWILRVATEAEKAADMEDILTLAAVYRDIEDRNIRSAQAILLDNLYIKLKRIDEDDIEVASAHTKGQLFMVCETLAARGRVPAVGGCSKLQGK